MKKTIVLSTALLVVCGVARASSPDAWEAHYQEVASSCIKASGLREARRAGDFVDFDDRIGYTAVVIQGRYPQPHMKNQSGRVLCLYDKRSRIPHISQADAIIKSSRP